MYFFNSFIKYYRYILNLFLTLNLETYFIAFQSVIFVLIHKITMRYMEVLLKSKRMFRANFFFLKFILKLWFVLYRWFQLSGSVIILDKLSKGSNNFFRGILTTILFLLQRFLLFFLNNLTFRNFCIGYVIFIFLLELIDLPTNKTLIWTYFYENIIFYNSFKDSYEHTYDQLFFITRFFDIVDDELHSDYTYKYLINSSSTMNGTGSFVNYSYIKGLNKDDKLLLNFFKFNNNLKLLPSLNLSNYYKLRGLPKMVNFDGAIFSKKIALNLLNVKENTQLTEKLTFLCKLNFTLKYFDYFSANTEEYLDLCFDNVSTLEKSFIYDNALFSYGSSDFSAIEVGHMLSWNLRYGFPYLKNDIGCEVLDTKFLDKFIESENKCIKYVLLDFPSDILFVKWKYDLLELVLDRKAFTIFYNFFLNFLDFFSLMCDIKKFEFQRLVFLFINNEISDVFLFKLINNIKLILISLINFFFDKLIGEYFIYVNTRFMSSPIIELFSQFDEDDLIQFEQFLGPNDKIDTDIFFIYDPLMDQLYYDLNNSGVYFTEDPEFEHVWYRIASLFSSFYQFQASKTGFGITINPLLYESNYDMYLDYFLESEYDIRDEDYIDFSFPVLAFFQDYPNNFYSSNLIDFENLRDFDYTTFSSLGTDDTFDSDIILVESPTEFYFVKAISQGFFFIIYFLIQNCVSICFDYSTFTNISYLYIILNIILAFLVFFSSLITKKELKFIKKYFSKIILFSKDRKLEYFSSYLAISLILRIFFAPIFVLNYFLLFVVMDLFLVCNLFIYLFLNLGQLLVQYILYIYKRIINSFLFLLILKLKKNFIFLKADGFWKFFCSGIGYIYFLLILYLTKMIFLILNFFQFLILIFFYFFIGIFFELYLDYYDIGILDTELEFFFIVYVFIGIVGFLYLFFKSFRKLFFISDYNPDIFNADNFEHFADIKHMNFLSKQDLLFNVRYKPHMDANIFFEDLLDIEDYFDNVGDDLSWERGILDPEEEFNTDEKIDINFFAYNYNVEDLGDHACDEEEYDDFVSELIDSDICDNIARINLELLKEPFDPMQFYLRNIDFGCYSSMSIVREMVQLLKEESLVSKSKDTIKKPYYLDDLVFRNLYLPFLKDDNLDYGAINDIVYLLDLYSSSEGKVEDRQYFLLDILNCNLKDNYQYDFSIFPVETLEKEALTQLLFEGEKLTFENYSEIKQIFFGSLDFEKLIAFKAKNQKSDYLQFSCLFYVGEIYQMFDNQYKYKFYKHLNFYIEFLNLSNFPILSNIEHERLLALLDCNIIQWNSIDNEFLQKRGNSIYGFYNYFEFVYFFMIFFYFCFTTYFLETIGAFNDFIFDEDEDSSEIFSLFDEFYFSDILEYCEYFVFLLSDFVRIKRFCYYQFYYKLYVFENYWLERDNLFFNRNFIYLKFLNDRLFDDFMHLFYKGANSIYERIILKKILNLFILFRDKCNLFHNHHKTFGNFQLFLQKKRLYIAQKKQFDKDILVYKRFKIRHNRATFLSKYLEFLSKYQKKYNWFQLFSDEKSVDLFWISFCKKIFCLNNEKNLGFLRFFFLIKFLF